MAKTKQESGIKILHYVLSELKWLILVIIVNLLWSLTLVVWSLFMANLTNFGVEGNLNGLQKMIVFAIIFIVGLAIIYYFSIATFNRFNRRCKSKLYGDVFRAIFQKNSVDFTSVHSGTYISLMNNELEQVYMEYITPLVNIILQGISFLVASLALLYYDYRLFLVQLLLSVLPFIKTAIMGSRVAKEQEKYLVEKSAYVSKIKDFFTAHEVLSVGKTKVKITDIHADTSQALFQTEEKFNNVRAVSSSLTTVFHYLDGIVFLLLASYLLAKGEIVIGTMIGAMQISNYVTVPAIQLSQFSTQIIGIKPIVRKIEKILNEDQGEKKYMEDSIKKEIFPIRYVDYGVHYEKNIILKDINIQLEKGKKYAIVGPSGAGKTTLLRSIMQYFDENHHKGSLYYNDILAEELNPTSLNEKIAYIEQKVFLFEGTIKENIGLFTEYAEEDYIDVLKIIHGERFLGNSRLNNFTVLEMGKNLSGGEIQKIAIARALLQKKEVFLCDEITANIDKSAAGDIYDVLLNDENITLFNITHQMDQEFLRAFDEILFVDKKTILEAGSFESLIKQKQSFYHYWSYYSSVEESNN